MYRRLRDMREDADKTQAELAAVLNVGQTTYSRYENDRNPAAERQRPQGAAQIESRAKHCRQYFAQRVQSAYCQAFYGRVEGPRPLMCFPTAFAHTKAVPAEHRRALPRAAQREKRGYSPP